MKLEKYKKFIEDQRLRLGFKVQEDAIKLRNILEQRYPDDNWSSIRELDEVPKSLLERFSKKDIEATLYSMYHKSHYGKVTKKELFATRFEYPHLYKLLLPFCTRDRFFHYI